MHVPMYDLAAQTAEVRAEAGAAAPVKNPVATLSQGELL